VGASTISLRFIEGTGYAKFCYTSKRDGQLAAKLNELEQRSHAGGDYLMPRMRVGGVTAWPRYVCFRPAALLAEERCG
jgi:hypothetical protein